MAIKFLTAFYMVKGKIIFLPFLSAFYYMHRSSSVCKTTLFVWFAGQNAPNTCQISLHFQFAWLVSHLARNAYNTSWAVYWYKRCIGFV